MGLERHRAGLGNEGAPREQGSIELMPNGCEVDKFEGEVWELLLCGGEEHNAL